MANLDFKVKYLLGPEQKNPMDDLADALDELAAGLYPILVDGVPNSTMPDMANAVSMEGETIYKINSPGYFYKSGSSADNLAKSDSCLLLNSTQWKIDMIIIPVCTLSVHKDDNWQKVINGKKTVTKETEFEYSFSHQDKGETWGKDDFNREKKSDENDLNKYEQYNKKNLVVYGRLPNEGNTGSFSLGVPNVRKCMVDANKDKFTYFISSGENGGHINNMIPFVPGEADPCACDVAHNLFMETMWYANSGKKTIYTYINPGGLSTFVAWTFKSSSNTSKVYFIPPFMTTPVQIMTKIRSMETKNIQPGKPSGTITNYKVFDVYTSDDSHTVVKERSVSFSSTEIKISTNSHTDASEGFKNALYGQCDVLSIHDNKVVINGSTIFVDCMLFSGVKGINESCGKTGKWNLIKAMSRLKVSVIIDPSTDSDISDKTAPNNSDDDDDD